jgi:hypothetical protein
VQLKAAPVAGYTGDVHVQGGDAGLVLTGIRERTLPDWIASKFDDEPFVLDAGIAVRDGVVRLSDVQLERGALQLRGWWLLGANPRAGALLLEYGGLSVGIDGSQPGQVVLRAGREWLQARPPPFELAGGGARPDDSTQ